MQNIAPMIGAGISFGGIIFHIGKHSEKLSILNFKVDALEEKKKNNNKLKNKIKSKLLFKKKKLKKIKKKIKKKK